MQALAFRAADMRFAIALSHVVQVLHDCRLRPVPLAPAAVTGLIRYGAEMIPVVDLGLLLGFAPAAMRRSTRLIVIRIALPASRLFAVRAEEVLDLIQIGPSASGLELAENRWLGEHILDDAHTAQLINPQALLPEELHTLYFEHGASVTPLLPGAEASSAEASSADSPSADASSAEASSAELAKPC